MASAGIIRLGTDAAGVLKGKDKLRAYWSQALAKNPNVHFVLLDVSVSPDSVVVRYRNDRGHTVSEYLRMNDRGLSVQGSANHVAGS